MPKIAVAVQLYTVRELVKEDFAGTMAKIAAIGYRAVEIGTYQNIAKAREARKVLADNGLAVIGAHTGIDALETNLNSVLDEYAIFESRNVVCPFMPEPRRKDAAGWKQVAQSLTRIGQECAKRGLVLSYHNHSFEFQEFDGKAGMDILLEDSDPATVRLELDTYWVQHGDEEPVAYMTRLGSRVRLLHLKDMARGPEQRFAPVGTGILDFPAILKSAASLGIAWAAVEQDQCYELHPIEALRVSFQNLQRMGAV